MTYCRLLKGGDNDEADVKFVVEVSCKPHRVWRLFNLSLFCSRLEGLPDDPDGRWHDISRFSVFAVEKNNEFVVSRLVVWL